jgi:hypothetical protein
MIRRRSLGKSLALGCGGLILLLVVLVLAAYLGLRLTYGGRSRSALARLKASGAPTTWEQVIPPPVPDDQNAALLYEKAIAAMLPPSQALDEYAGSNPAERRKTQSQVASILALDSSTLHLLAEAAKRPKCRFNRNWNDPINMSFVEMFRLKSLTRLVSAQAVLQADRGDVPGALQTWLINAAMVKHLESDPMLLSQVTAVAVTAISAASLPQILEDSRPSPEACRRVAQALAGLDLRRAFVRSLEAERVLNLRWMHEAGQNLGYLPGASPVPGLKASARTGLAAAAYQFLAPLDDAAMLRLWDKQIALARKPYRQTIKQFDALERDIPPYALLTRTFVGSTFGRAVGARDRGIAYVGMMRVELGLAAYRSQFGAYPRSLNDLRKALRWDVPADPFSGKDFVYHRKGAGFVLYSIGPDLRDDGGVRLGGTSGGGIGGDIPYRIERQPPPPAAPRLAPTAVPAPPPPVLAPPRPSP